MLFFYISVIFSDENAMHYRVTSSISYLNTQHTKTAHSVMQELEVINKVRRSNKCMNMFSLNLIMKPFAGKGVGGQSGNALFSPQIFTGIKRWKEMLSLGIIIFELSGM